MVFGVGDEHAEVMFIGEGPGEMKICRVNLLWGLPLSAEYAEIIGLHP